MNERTFNSYEKADIFAALVRKLSGQDAIVVQVDSVWVVRPYFGRKSIIDVTEELLRQVAK
ncbi:MAG: hypothetical protein JWR25_1173 [Noviherbaspirillum sp.]|jgi:hypothetical protein|nr:hypothetical protein [Noviherbaspirillum sp.]MDB5794794.1 hypothetical protein [Noviherbaspirillum sp.]